jgi:sucrose phosphorylase
VGLLAGRNDIKLVERTKNGRDINRHGYSLDEIEQEIKRPVVQRLLRLMTFRSYYPAFNGEFKIESSPEDQVVLTWRKGKHNTTLHVDLNNYTTRITYYDPTVDARKPFIV